jgi:hypothetical protein
MAIFIMENGDLGNMEWKGDEFYDIDRRLLTF